MDRPSVFRIKSEKTRLSGTGIYPFVVAATLCATVLQKIALPGTGNALPIATVALPTIVTLAWFFGRFYVDRTALILFSMFAMEGIFSFFANAETQSVSIASLLLILTINYALVFRTAGDGSDLDRGISFFRDLMFWIGIAGVLQYVLQGKIDTKYIFPIDYYTPKEFYLDFYNSLNPIEFGSSQIKSNGVVLAEPSIFSQFVAFAMIVEWLSKRRPARLIGFAAALMSSLSGTGIIVLVVFGLYRAVRQGQIAFLIGAALLAVTVFVFSEALRLNLVTDRIDEFVTPNSSGHARFVSIFFLLDQITFSSFLSALLGQGAGTITTFYSVAPFMMFDPTWGKLLFEYGFIGFSIYFMLWYRVTRKSRGDVIYPIVANYFICGGYLSNACLLTISLILAAWRPSFGTGATYGRKIPVKAEPPSRVPRVQVGRT